MMKIAAVKTYLVEGSKYNWTLLKIETDKGIHGWGEATNWPGSPLIEAACIHAGERILGMDARRIDFLWTKLYKDLNWLGQAGPVLSAISAVDIALWDIQAKALGVPVYQLLGGKYRDKLLLYANYWFTQGNHTVNDYTWQAQKVVEAGFSAMKFDPFAHVNYLYGEDLSTDLSLSPMQKRLSLEVTRGVQEAVGQDVQLAIETHAMLNGYVAVEMAHKLREVNINCLWYEEPAPPEMPDAIADIRARIGLPVAVGERLHSRYMFRPVLEKRAADVIMPDITRCGGISEMRKIATMAEAFNVLVAPHNPNGPISTIAAAHAMASVPNFLRLEFMFHDVAWRDTILSEPLPIERGYFVLPDRPGLGFDVDESRLEAHPGVRQARAGFYV
jgi:galactonate dehydratase